MRELDRLIRETLEERAQSTPETPSLSRAVHARARGLRRRRMVVGAALSALVGLVGVPLAVGALRGADGGRPTGPGSSVSSPAPSGSPSPSPSGNSSPAPSLSSTPSPSLVSPAGSHTMSWRLPDSVAAEFEQPVVTLQDSALVAHYVTLDPVGGADVTLIVTGDRPGFASASAQVTETTTGVRSRTGTLRVVATSPAAELTLYWQESESQWIQVRSDDTLTTEQLVALGDQLVASDLALDAGLRLGLVPAGASQVTATPFSSAFEDSGEEVLSCALVNRRALEGDAVSVGSYSGALTHDGAWTTLMVWRSDVRLTLIVEVAADRIGSDADLVRLAESVEILDRAESQEAAASDIGSP